MVLRVPGNGQFLNGPRFRFIMNILVSMGFSPKISTTSGFHLVAKLKHFTLVDSIRSLRFHEIFCVFSFSGSDTRVSTGKQRVDFTI